MTDRLKPPHETAGDLAHFGGRLLSSLVPTGSEFFSALIRPPIQKRTEEWMDGVYEKLKELDKQLEELGRGSLKIDELRSNPVFTTTVAQAIQVAMRNHQAEKLGALHNAILNAALPGAPEDSLQQMFLGYVDIFTEWHLRILKFFHQPAQPSGEHAGVWAGSPSKVLEFNFPDLKGRQSFYDQVWNDLKARGLVVGELHINTTLHGALAKKTTATGDQFLKFISEPEAK